MADVLRFSDYAPKSGDPSRPDRPAEVIILPVVRIERHPDKPKRKLKQKA